jgi:hypothetical protein
MDTCLELRQIPQDFVGNTNEKGKKNEKRYAVSRMSEICTV